MKAVTDATSPLDAYSEAVVGVAARLRPSVVSVSLRRRGRDGHRRPAGAGSAVVLSPDGYLLTCAHVVADADGGTVTTADGTVRDLEVIGVDRLSELAVLRVDASDLPAVTLGDADTLQVGQLVVAVGDPLGYVGSVSAGVVSATGRALTVQDGASARLIEDVIQTDASLHPGNSGGALADASGRVVGVNTALVGPGLGQGLGLAVPINARTERIVGELLHDGRVRRAWLGIGGGRRPLGPRIAASSGHEHGVEVTTVVAESPAARAGVRPEDVVVTLDGVPVDRVGALQQLLTGERIGRTATLRLARGGELIEVEVVPEELTG